MAGGIETTRKGIYIAVELKNSFLWLRCLGKEKDDLSSSKVGRSQILACKRCENNQDVFLSLFLIFSILKIVISLSSITV